MRIIIQQTTLMIELDDEQRQGAYQPKPRPLSLLEKLWWEVERGRDANIWKKEKQHGEIFPEQG